MTLRALIFDVDGTLADTEEAHRCAFNAAFAEHGLGWHWNQRLYTALLGVTGGKERLQSYIERLDLPREDRARLHRQVPALHVSKTRHYARLIKDGHVTLRNGIAGLLEEARGAGLMLGIASTTTLTNVDELLKSVFGRSADDIFDIVACGDQVLYKKPAPDIYLLALSDLGIDAAEAVAFEDSAAGLLSAKTAGLCTIVSPTVWTAGHDFARADCVVRSFDDMFGLRGVRAVHDESRPHRTEAA